MSSRAVDRSTDSAHGLRVNVATFLRGITTLVLFATAVLVVGGTTAADAPTYAYDAPIIARTHVQEINAADARSVLLSVAKEESARPLAEARGTSTTSSRSVVATEAGGARFVAGSDGVVTDLVGGSPNAVVLGKYPAYVNEGAATGARTFSMSDEAWNVMTPAQQWTRNQQFLDQAISRGSEIRLATPPTASNMTGWYAREIEYLTKQGYTISSDGARMIPPGG